MEHPEGLYEAAGRRQGEQRLLVVLGVIGLALLLILGAFFVGRALGEDDVSTAEPGQQQEADGGDPDSLGGAAVGSEPPAQQSDEQSEAETGELSGEPYRGPREPVTPRIASARCQAGDSVDAGGRRVSYSPMHMIDDRPTSAWRCHGDGKGQKVRFQLPREETIVAVGLVPGYAKTDPVDGTDRYRENRRIKQVRWIFDTGGFVVQTFDHRPGRRGIQRMRIPAVETSTVTMEILSSTQASRDTVAVSTAFFAAAR